MANVLVLGSGGMLGRYVRQYLDATGVNRLNFEAVSFVDRIGKQSEFQALLRWKQYDAVVNCIGVINTRVDELGVVNTLKINSVFPHMLAECCEVENTKLIHVSTDCVFSGKTGSNSCEKTPHDAKDLYGRSKSMGEPDNCAVIRTSIIGEEVGQKRSLVEWVKSQKNGACNGYTNHYWNGITCLQFAKVVEQMIDKDLFWSGVRHIYTSPYVAKDQLIGMVNEIYELGIAITPVEVEACDRRLFSIFEDTWSLVRDIPSLRTQIEEMKEFELK